MIKIIIPISLCSLNEYINAERTNKHIAAKIKKNQTFIVSQYTKHYKKEFQGLKLPLKLKFTWVLKDKKKDLDNVCFSKKFVLDGLVNSGCLENDGQKQINAFEDVIKYGNQEIIEIEIFENRS
jgi:hypothetical protein